MPRGFWHPKLKRPRTPLADRLWARVEKTDGCWLWRGAARGRMGYGHISIRSDDPLGSGGKMIPVHRAAWAVTHGRPVPDGLQVCHRCDVPACVNPAHLFLGTAKDNSDDKIRKGRMRFGCQRGADHHRAKLTADQVKDIYRRSVAGENQRALATEFNVHQSDISRIAGRKRWQSVTVGL